MNVSGNNRRQWWVPSTWGLKTRTIASFIAAWLLGCSFLTVSLYRIMLHQHHESIRTRLHDYVAIAAKTIDPEQHALLKASADEGGEVYRSIVTNLRSIRDSISDIKFVYTVRLNQAGKIVFIADAEESAEDQSHIGDVFDSASVVLHEAARSAKKPVVETDFITDEWGTFLSAYAPIRQSDGRLDGLVAMDISLATVEKETRTLLAWAVSVSTAVSLMIVILALFLARTITRPIQRTADMLKDIAEGEGDLTRQLEITTRDELGTMAHWFNTFLEKLRGIIREVSTNATVVNESSGKLLEIASNLAANANETSTKSNNVAKATDEVSANMQEVADTMEENTSNTSMVAAAVEEMAATINEIAHNSEKARSISESAVQQATAASVKMNDLENAAKAISVVTETITEISEQTNLLALNATIEAARAGDAGKGFAVVANEIKELAKQTATATADIRAKIEGVQGTTAETLHEIESITSIINDINDIIATIATAVEEQSVATGEISGNVTQTSNGISQVNENIAEGSAVISKISLDITELNASTGSISENSSTIRQSAESLRQLATKLNLLIGRFKY